MTSKTADITPEPDTKPDAVPIAETKPGSKVDWGKVGAYIAAVSVLGAGVTALLNISNRFDRVEQNATLSGTRLMAVEVAKEKVAVIESKLERQGEDIREIKTDIKELLKRK